MDLMRPVDHLWPVTNRLMGLHVAVYRATRGTFGHRVPFAPPMALLTHTGAKSGKVRTSALVYFRDEDNVILVASKGGHPRHPAWFHNLRANPDADVQVGSRRMAVRARVASATERKRLWPKAVATYSGFETYQERTAREIPLVILEPRR